MEGSLFFHKLGKCVILRNRHPLYAYCAIVVPVVRVHVEREMSSLVRFECLVTAVLPLIRCLRFAHTDIRLLRAMVMLAKVMSEKVYLHPTTKAY